MNLGLASQSHLGLKNILVPTDFSEASVKALNYGAAFAERFGATLWLVHIVEPDLSFTETEGVVIPVAPSERQKLADAEHLMAGFAAKHLPLNVSVTSLVRCGSTVSELSALAEGRDMDLIVVSTHGRNGIDRALFGSVAERIVHHAPCPILIVREGEREFLKDASSKDEARVIRLNRILVKVDFSDCSKKALRYAEAFAKQFKAGILCLHVLEPEKPLLFIETQGFRKKQRADAEKQMAGLLSEFDKSSQIDGAIKSGTRQEIIGLADNIDWADEQQTDLIIVGEHQRSGMGRFLLGSATDEVVRHAHCPVLVVREVEHEFVA